MPPRATRCRRKREVVEIKLASLALLHQYPKPAPTTLGVLNKSVAKRTILGEIDKVYLLKQNSERLKRSQSCIS